MNLLSWILIAALIMLLHVAWGIARSWWKQRSAKQVDEQLAHKAEQPSATNNDLSAGRVNHQAGTPSPSNQIHEPLMTNQPLIGPRKPEARKPLKQASAVSIPEYISLNLICPKDNPIDGLRLMQLINEHSLKLNEAGFFQSRGDDGNIHFKIANIVSPGTFNLSAMQGFTTEGLMLFTVRKETNQPKASWLQMWQLAERIVVIFSAELRDEQHQLLTEERLAQLQQCVMQWEQSPIT